MWVAQGAIEAVLISLFCFYILGEASLDHTGISSDYWLAGLTMYFYCYFQIFGCYLGCHFQVSHAYQVLVPLAHYWYCCAVVGRPIHSAHQTNSISYLQCRWDSQNNPGLIGLLISRCLFCTVNSLSPQTTNAQPHYHTPGFWRYG